MPASFSIAFLIQRDDPVLSSLLLKLRPRLRLRLHPGAPRPADMIHARLCRRERLPDGANAHGKRRPSFILGPTHSPAPELIAQEGTPQGTVFTFAMESADTKFYPGIAVEANSSTQRSSGGGGGTIVTTSHPTSHVGAVYVPDNVLSGTAVPPVISIPDRRT